MLDEYNTFMIEYMCKRERDTFLPKRVNKGEKINEKEDWKSYYRGHRVY